MANAKTDSKGCYRCLNSCLYHKVFHSFIQKATVEFQSAATTSRTMTRNGCDSFPVNFEGKSYDIKKFIHDHPGGVNTLKLYKGKNILHAMEKYGHSVSAYHMLGDFKVDELKNMNLSGEVSCNGRIVTDSEANRDVEEINFLEELESRLDWSKPILNQIDRISEHYHRWVNSAVYRECHLFSNPVIEAMTFTPWYLVPMFWVPIILYLGITQYYEYVDCGGPCPDQLSTVTYASHLLRGVLIWTILEYSLHRWVFHFDPGSSITMMKIHFVIHGMHHKVPFDKYRLVFPPIPAFAILCILYTILHSSFTYPMLKVTGVLAGYLTYDMMHFYVHNGSPKDGSYLYAMKRYHSNHHFVNHDKAFGISCKFWDYVFKTFVCLKRLGFSLNWNY